MEDWTIVLVVVNGLNLGEDFLVDEGVGLGLELDRRSRSISPFIQRVAILVNDKNM